MANSKITDLTELTSVANEDVLVIVDDSATETKKITFANLSSGISVGAASEVTFTAKNNTGSTIALGKAVYISGADGSDTTIALADNTSASTMPAFGITKEAIANGATGTVVLGGSFSGINTSSFSEGDVLYVGTSGDLTDTKPTGTGLIQNLAKVAKAAASGSVVVTGAGRTNDLPNLANDYLWVGDSNGVPAQVEGPNANGELLIGGTSGLAAATLTAGGFTKITNGDGTITVASGEGAELDFRIESSAVSAAGNAEGTIVKFGTGTLVAGQIYTHASGAWVAVDADAQTTTEGLLGMALGTSPTDDGLLVHGVGYLSHDPGAAGDVLYVHTTAGQLSATQPSATGDFVRVAGYCLADNKVFFSPSQDFIEIG